MSRKVSKFYKGMTLVELIIGIALLGIITIALINAYTTSIYWSVVSGDRTKNTSIASGVVENALEGTVIQNSLTEIDTVEILGPGGNVIIIPNASYSEDNTIDLEIMYKGSTTNSRLLTNVTKITINSEKDTINGSSVQTEIEVFKP